MNPSARESVPARGHVKTVIMARQPPWFVMKKRFPILVMLILAGLAVGHWARNLPAGMPWPAYLYEAGRVLALIGFILVSFQYAWVSGVGWIGRGIGPAKLLAVHRRCGVIALVCILLHPSLIVLSERLQGYAGPLGPFRGLGILTALILIVTGGAALFNLKLGLPYKTWKKIHRGGYLILPLAFTHSFVLGSSLHGSLLRPMWLFLAAMYCALLFHRFWKQRVAGSGP